MFANHQIEEAAKIFMELLKRKVILNEDTAVFRYFEDPAVADALRIIAREAGVHVHDTGHRLHLLVDPLQSQFATNITHLKTKYGKVEKKVFFYLIQIIMMAVIAEFDHEDFLYKGLTDGISYLFISKEVSRVLEGWKALDEESLGAFSTGKKLAISEMIETWGNLKLQTPGQEESEVDSRTSSSRFGLIQEAMRIFEDEKLVTIHDRHVYPREELFERIIIYRDEDRLKEIRSYIEIAKEKEVQHASN